MMEVNEIASQVEEQASDEAILIFGASVSEENSEELTITVIATGFGSSGLDDDIKDNNRVGNSISNRHKQIVTEEGFNATEVTLDDIFKETRHEDKSDSKFDIPTFLSSN